MRRRVVRVDGPAQGWSSVVVEWPEVKYDRPQEQLDLIRQVGGCGGPTPTERGRSGTQRGVA